MSARDTLGAYFLLAGIVATSIAGFWISVPIGAFVLGGELLGVGILLASSEPDEPPEHGGV